MDFKKAYLHMGKYKLDQDGKEEGGINIDCYILLKYERYYPDPENRR